MLDKCIYDVAIVRKISNKSNAQLALNYYSSTDLNQFFSSAASDELSKFSSIEFFRLIEMHKKIVKDYNQQISFDNELRLLQLLRNNEIHFWIDNVNFLSESNFTVLHNFMIEIYGIIKFYNLLPYFGKSKNEYRSLDFDRYPISDFSYEFSFRTSEFAKKIANLINGEFTHSPYCSAYDISSSLCQRHTELQKSFDSVWSVVEIMQKYNIIRFQEYVEENYDDTNNPSVYYVMTAVL